MDSKYPHVRSDQNEVARKTRVGAGPVTLELNRDYPTKELLLTVLVSEAFATSGPTSTGDTNRVIGKIDYKTGSVTQTLGRGDVVLPAHEFCEPSSTDRVVTPAGAGTTSTIMMQRSIHLEDDEADMDKDTALRTKKLNKHELKIDLVDPAAADAGVFIGGVGAVTPTFEVIVEAITEPDVQDSFENEVDGYKLPYGSRDLQFLVNSRTQSDISSQIELNASQVGLLRFLHFRTFDTTGAYPVASDDVLESVTLSTDSGDKRLFNWKQLQLQNQRRRSKNPVGSGCATIDKGDAVAEFLDLIGKRATVSMVAASGAPASFSIEVCEVFSIPKSEKELFKSVHG